MDSRVISEAMKPIKAREAHRKIGYRHDCPKCGYALGFKEKKCGILPRWMRRTVLYEECLDYCGFCGQRIDWS